MKPVFILPWAAILLVGVFPVVRACRGEESEKATTKQAVVPAAKGAKDEPLPATSLLFHNDGSLTVTVDGKPHKLSPHEIRQRVPKLLAGKEHIVIRMEDWKQLGRGNYDIFPSVYNVGVRRVTLDVEHEGKRERRTRDLQPPTLAEQIKGTDPAVRKAALKKLDKMFDSGNIGGGMAVLLSTRTVQFDRTKYLPFIRRALRSDNDQLIGSAISTIAIAGGDELDIPAVVRHADNESLNIRTRIAHALCGLDPRGTNPDAGKTIEKLLSDENSFVRDATLRSLWGKAVSPGVDAKIIELSRGEPGGGSSEADIAIYYALTTRPLVRRPVADRLVEIINTPRLYNSRSVWGISHHRAEDDARPVIVKTLIEVIDSEEDGGARDNAVYGLGLHGGAAAIAKLKLIATDPNESNKTRQRARQMLPADLRPPMDGASR